MSYQNGFTLLEVLVALVVLGLSLAFLDGSISDSLLRAGRIDNEDRATGLADNMLASLGQDVPLRIGTTDGEAGNLTWRLVIGAQPGSSTAIPLDHVELTIATRSRHPIGHWQTLRVAPQAAAP